MEAQHVTQQVSPQFREILRFQCDMTKRSGRPISLSEAIAGWIALGLAEEFRESYFRELH